MRRGTQHIKKEELMARINLFDFNRRLSGGLLTRRSHPSEDLIIWNYTPRCAYAGAWDYITLQARGLITTNDGTIVARPFPKFFNYEELNGGIPAEPFKVYEKMDGSLGIMYWVNDKPFISTRGSFESEMAAVANRLLQTKYQGVRFNSSLTYLFEIVYRANRIVVDYGDTEDLFFLAAIDTETGEEYEIGDPGTPRAKQYDGIRDLSEIKQYENDRDEGFVIRFESGLRVKIKFAEYKRLHKLLTQVSSKSIWESLRDGKPLDEILERVPDEFYRWVRKTKADLERQYATVEALAKAEFRDMGDRKESALYYKTCNSSPSILFNMLDEKPYDQLIWKGLRPKFEKPFREDVG